MKTGTRLAIIGASALVCAGGVLIANFERDRISANGAIDKAADAISLNDGYQYAASGSRPKLTFRQLETIIRRGWRRKQRWRK
jgi:hypothetical protein